MFSHIKVPHKGVPGVNLSLTPGNQGSKDELANRPSYSWPIHQEDRRVWWELRVSLFIGMDSQFFYEDIVSFPSSSKEIQAFPDLTQQAWHSIPRPFFRGGSSSMAVAESETKIGSRFSHGTSRRLQKAGYGETGTYSLCPRKEKPDWADRSGESAGRL